MIRRRSLQLLTVGHSVRTHERFLALLKAHEVEHLVDVRRLPQSRRNPQFNQEPLAAALEQAEIQYSHLPGLGGLRHARKDSTNIGWRNDSFRGYADYMQTPDFEVYLHELLKLAAASRVAIMCAEALPWRCHRSLLSDALVARGVEVGHIMSRITVQPHEVHVFAHIEGTRVTYPGKTQD